MVSIAHAVLGLVLVAASHSTVRADSINANPITVGDGLNKLNDRNPAAGRPVPKASTTYIVPDAVQPLAKALADVPTTAGNGNGTDAHTRMLEATSTDVQRLEEHFGTAMERNVDALLSGGYRAAAYAPTPWPSSYWPTYADGINYRWAGDSEPSASEKYAAAFGLNVKQFTETISRNTGILAWSGNRPCGQKSDCDSLNDGSQCAIRRGENRGWCIPGWYGICHAWAPASFMEKEPRCPVTKNGQTFHVFDIKALMTQVYDGAGVGIVFTGARYDGPDWPESRDEYGRFTDAAERDLGPGFFHIAISNVLGRFKKGFVVDVTASSQVWNQPVRSYEVLENYEISRTDAAQAWFNTNQYPFNNQAASLMYVRTRLSWMNEAVEDGPLIENGRADAYTASRDYQYVLELDAQRRIIGGEWIGQSQTEHPDFLWFPTGRPDISTVTAIGLSYKNVIELLDASVKCGDVTPPDNGGGDCAPSGGSCGNNNVGAKCCQSSGDYCQPWNPWEYQCRAAPQECGTQQVGVDFYGNDIKALYSILPEQCCAECARTPGCKAYTFVNYNADGRAACYLKSGTGERRQVVGVVSAEVKNPLPPSDNSCSTPVGGMCGSASGHGCCPSGAYCQAWNSGYYQCINTPPQCGVQFTDVDFYGNDIRFVSNVSPAQCCEECARTAGCRVYTFINENPDGLTTCYLKSSGAGFSVKVGAVSGVLN